MRAPLPNLLFIKQLLLKGDEEMKTRFIRFLTVTGLVISLIPGVFISPTVARASTVCPAGYVVSGSNCVLTTTYAASGGTGGPVSINNIYFYNSAGGDRTGSVVLYFSDDNVNWVTAFEGSEVVSGYTCSLKTVTGGGGSYGAHMYWRVWMPPNPKLSRYGVLQSNGIAIALETFASDNCSDAGSWPSGYFYYTAPAAVPLSCNAGDSLSGSTCTNVITIAGTFLSDRCPVGSYDDPNDGTKCILNGGSIAPAIAPTQTYSCATGYVLTYTLGVAVPECKTLERTYPAISKTDLSCPGGGILTGSNCVTAGKYVSQDYTATSTTTYTCSPGDTLGGFTCYSVGGALVRTYIADRVDKINYTCPNGGSLFGLTCYVAGYLVSSYAATATTSYLCSAGGTRSGQYCYFTSSSYYPVNVITNYSCPSGGTLSATTCYVYSLSREYVPSSNTTFTYSCASGGTLSATTCYVYSLPREYAASVVSLGYSCPSGGTLEGTLCVKGYTTTTQTYPAISITTFSCPSGGDLNITICGFAGSVSVLIIKFSGDCLTNYKFNILTLLCDTVPYLYISDTQISLAGVYRCLTYSYGNLIDTSYFTYDATNSTVLGSVFERKCFLEVNEEGNISGSEGYYYCEITNKLSQEITSLISITDISGFKGNRSTICALRVDITEPEIDVFVFEFSQEVLDICDVIDFSKTSFAIYIQCQIIRNQ